MSQTEHEKNIQISNDLILWRIEGLEADTREIKKSLVALESSLKAYKAVMRFAMGVGAAVGSIVAFVVNLLWRQ